MSYPINQRLVTARFPLPLLLLLLLGLAVVCVVFSLVFGAADIAVADVYVAVTGQADEFKHLIIRTVRLPRVLSGALVGMALATAGAVMQGLTRNPLASPDILGINAGAAFMVVCALLIFGSPPLLTYALFAAIGAGIAALLVYHLGSMGAGGATPMKLTLAGAIFTAFVSALTTSLLIFNRQSLEQIRFWTAGSLSGRDFELFYHTSPYILVGLLLTLLLGKSITALSLGHTTATGLGVNTARVRQLAFLAVVLCAGGATALAGPVGFVGLIVPHVSRFLVGSDYRKVLPVSALLGAVLITLADIFARTLVRPEELPVGIVMGLIGAPFFIYLARAKL